MASEGGAIAEEFDVLAGRLGIEVPADLKDGVVRGYAGLRAMTELLREVRTDTAAPEVREAPGG
ncbi:MULTISPECIES: hypothetical protein [unclassified Streptomyces]|uniref:hypothetical protein n=1 Tax=unclassified Streptomyces TaxID=2593676 RepID=UPI0033AF2A57